MLVPPLVAGFLTPDEVTRQVVVDKVVWLVLTLILASAAAMSFARWRVGGEATLGWLAIALGACAVANVPLAIIDVATDSDPARVTGHLVAVGLSMPTLVLLALAATGVQVHARIHPLGLAVGIGLAVLCLRLVALSVLDGPIVTFPHPTGAVLAICLGIAYLVLLLALHRRQERQVPTLAQFGIVAGTLLAASLLGALGPGGHTVGSRLAVASMLAMSVALCYAASGIILETMAQQARRILPGTTPGEGAAGFVRGEAERLHELRSTVADIASASRVLLRHDERLSRSTQSSLELMLLAELRRLERLVTPGDSGTARSTALSLDEIIEPLVGCQVALGHDVRWQSSGHWVHGRHDDVAEIVHVLLHNALRHAAGTTITLTVQRPAGSAAVELVVADQGPGIPVAMHGSVFTKGTRGASSPGSGLGLYLARRLAEEHGGSLRLRHDPDHAGATFVLTLPDTGLEESCSAREPAHELQ